MDVKCKLFGCVAAGFLAVFLFLPGEAQASYGSVSRVQRGSADMASVNVRDITIVSVNPEKTIVFCDHRVSSSNPSARVSCELTNSTTLRLTVGVAIASTVEWQVIEFSSGVRVQRDITNLAIATASTTLTISSIDTAKAFVFLTDAASSTDQLNDEDWTVRARFPSATSLEIARNESDTMAITVAWQVVEMDLSDVRTGLVTIQKTFASTTATLAPAVNPNKTFVLFTRAADSGTAGIEGKYMVMAELNAAGNTITFTRFATLDTVDISWWAVQMLDGTTVRRGLAPTLLTTDTQANSGLSMTAADGTRTVFFQASMGGDTTQTANLDETSWNVNQVSATTLQAIRASAGTQATTSWQAVEFNKRFDRLRGKSIRLRGRQVRLF